MRMKFIQSIPALLGLIIIGFRELTVWCILTAASCSGTLISQISLTITKPLYFFALYSLPLALILAFIPREIFKSWLKFAAWGIPLVLLFIWATPVSSAQLIAVGRDDAARLSGIAFSVVSLILIAYHFFLNSRKNRG